MDLINPIVIPESVLPIKVKVKRFRIKAGVNRKYRVIMSLWRVVILSWLCMCLTAQISSITNLSKERDYLRGRLFAEMNLRIKVQELTGLQNQIHTLYEIEIALLRHQVEMSRVDGYIAKTNRKLTPQVRYQIVQAAYNCSNAVGIDPLFSIAVMEQESRFQVYAKSDKDAHGLMQLIPSTAAMLGISRDKIYDIKQNVCGGITYLAKHIKTYNGELKLVLRRYYGGGEEWEYPQPVLARYARIQDKIRL